MSKPIQDGGPAFPGFDSTSGHGSAKRNSVGEWENYVPGMTLRDYFAAQALAGKTNWRGLRTIEDQELCASECYSIADAMLKERE